MVIDRCPGRDQRVWHDQDVYEVPCPQCGASVEFWKDDAQHKCEKCGEAATMAAFGGLSASQSTPGKWKPPMPRV